MILQVKVFDGFLDDGFDLVDADALDQSIEFDSLFNGHLGEDSIVLWAVPDELPRILELFLDVIALDRDLTRGRRRISRQTLEGGRLSSTIDSKKREALTIVQTKRGLLDGANGSSTERVVLLLEVVNTNAVDVVGIILSINTDDD